MIRVWRHHRQNPAGRPNTTMSTDAFRPDKTDGTTGDSGESLTMAQLENALHQRPLVGTCPECGSDATLTREDLYHCGPLARQTCDSEDCFWDELHPHAALLRGLELPDDLEVQQ